MVNSLIGLPRNSVDRITDHGTDKTRNISRERKAPTQQQAFRQVFIFFVSEQKNKTTSQMLDNLNL